jgi:HlyD family secretion protein
MRFAKGWIWAIVFGIALLALIGWRVGTRGQASDLMAKGGGGSRKPSVEVSIAKPAEIINTINVVGDIESPQTVDISPKITGRIEFLNAREGDIVKAGQELVRIDPSELQQQLLSLQAGVAEAKSKLAQALLTQGSSNVGVQTQVQQQQAAVTSAQADYNQMRENYDAQVQRAQSAVNDSAAKLNASKVQVKNSQAQLALQQSNLKNARVKLERMQTLFSQGAVSQQTRDDAQTALEVQEQNVNVAQGQVAAAEAAVQSAEATLSSSKDQLSIEKKQGIANIASAKARFTQAQSGLKAAVANKSQTPALQANIDALESGVISAQAQYDAAIVRLQDTVLRSPIDGAVTGRAADPGGLSSPGRSILTVQALDWVYVNSAIPMEEAAGVREGMNAQVTIDSLPGEVFTGPITNLNPSADMQSRQFGISIRLANPQKMLKPGMYARVGIVTQSVRAPVAVPIEALNKRDKEASVTVVDKEGIAHVVPVKVGASDGKVTQITSGLRAGDQVITLSYSPVKDGQEVTLPGADGGEKGGQSKAGGRGTRGDRKGEKS